MRHTAKSVKKNGTTQLRLRKTYFPHAHARTHTHTQRRLYRHTNQSTHAHTHTTYHTHVYTGISSYSKTCGRWRKCLWFSRNHSLILFLHIRKNTGSSWLSKITSGEKQNLKSFVKRWIIWNTISLKETKKKEIHTKVPLHGACTSCYSMWTNYSPTHVKLFPLNEACIRLEETTQNNIRTRPEEPHRIIDKKTVPTRILLILVFLSCIILCDFWYDHIKDMKHIHDTYQTHNPITHTQTHTDTIIFKNTNNSGLCIIWWRCAQKGSFGKFLQMGIQKD